MTKLALLITRPQPGAERFIAQLSDGIREKFAVIASPLMQITPTNDQPDLTGYKGAIFTSRNAVGFAPDGGGRAAFCVGQATAKRAQLAGWHVIAAAQDADGLVEYLQNAGPVGPLIHLAGRFRRGEIAKRVRAAGIQVDVHTLYDQELLPLSTDAQSLLNGEGRIVVPLFSPRTAAHFMEQAEKLDKVTVIAMSEAVADACCDVQDANIMIAVAPNGQEMIRSVEKALCDISFA